MDKNNTSEARCLLFFLPHIDTNWDLELNSVNTEIDSGSYEPVEQHSNWNSKQILCVVVCSLSVK